MQTLEVRTLARRVPLPVEDRRQMSRVTCPRLFLSCRFPFWDPMRPCSAICRSSLRRTLFMLSTYPWLASCLDTQSACLHRIRAFIFNAQMIAGPEIAYLPDARYPPSSMLLMHVSIDCQDDRGQVLCVVVDYRARTLISCVKSQELCLLIVLSVFGIPLISIRRVIRLPSIVRACTVWQR